VDKRLDALVCALLDVSREYAKELILAGKVKINGKPQTKAGAKFPVDTGVCVDGQAPQFVSRGGVKLTHALQVFKLDLQGLLCMDIGASTGGFTDCMLQHGAKAVFAVENGRGQMSNKMLANPRVISREGLDIRDLLADDMPFAPQFVAADLSFISITLILPKIAELLAVGGKGVLLVKPQFEAGPGKVDKRGVIKDPKDRLAAIKKVQQAANDAGLVPKNLETSPITGQNGNEEYLLLFEKEK